MQRNFILGEEWLYYKIYCGKRTADKILIDIVKPLSEELLEKNLIDRWFFIRYSDPKPHLRLRFHLPDLSHLATVIHGMKNRISEEVANQTVWSIETAVYKRELERYGFNTIENSERIFYYDSQICVNIINLIEDDTLLFLFSLRYIDSILSIFGYTLENKIQFTQQHFKAFKNEFNADKILNKQLNVKYAGLKEAIRSFMFAPAKEYQIILDAITETNKEITPIAQQLSSQLNNENITQENLLSSYIHMTINRLFRDQQRLHELVCYSSLYRFYQFCKNTHAT